MFASSCPAGSSFVGEGALQGWMYEDPVQPGGTATVGSQQETLTLEPRYATGGNFSNIDQNWGGIDNAAPLLWYYSHESTTDLGCTVFGASRTDTTRNIYQHALPTEMQMTSNLIEQAMLGKRQDRAKTPK